MNRSTKPRGHRLNWLAAIATSAAAMAAAAAFGEPPRVVKAVPDNGDADVDPALSELRIEFDQDMSPGGQSLCGGGPTFPELTGKSRWVGKRTVVVPIRLKPDHSYSLSVNCSSFGNFRGASGESAEPYPIAFRTGSSGRRKAEVRLSRDEIRKAVTELRRAIDEKYAYRDLNGVDWKKLFDDAAPQLEKADTAPALGRAIAKLLAHAKDLHITVRVGDATLATYRRNAPANGNLVTLAGLVPDWKKHNAALSTGRFDDGIGYILITSWAREEADALEPAYAALSDFADAKGIVIDVRPNSGGDEVLARDFAGCFVSRPTVYSRNTYRSGQTPDGFTKPLDRVVEPHKGRPAYRGRVAVLMGPQNMSSCESFLLMMRHGGKARLFGERSWGSSGNPKPVELGHGIIVLLPSWRDMHPDGTLIEGKGIEPDELVQARREDFATSDPVLDAALAWIRKGKD